MAGEEDNSNNTVADDQETRAAPDEAFVDAAAPPAKKRGRKRKTENEGQTGKSVRRSERPRKNIRSLNEDYLSDVEEEVKKIKGKRGRKKKVAIGVGASNQEGEKPECIEQQQMGIEDESLLVCNKDTNCHQCKRNDKGRVVKCTTCNRKKFCISCIKNWYPDLKEEDIAKACPGCCGNCNCKACLQSFELIKAIKEKPETNNDHEVELSKYMLKILLPYLRRLDEEQMAEKDIEAKRQV